MEPYELTILRSLRKIIRVVDIHSRKINTQFQITVPQLLCLYSVARNPEHTMSELAHDINLGTSTVNGIVDRLEAKELICRRRSDKDRRKVFLDLTKKGKRLIHHAPPLLQETLSKKMAKLPELEQATISLALKTIVQLLDAEDIDASANLIPNDALNKENHSP